MLRTIALLLFVASSAVAQSTQPASIALPPPKLDKGMPLMQALASRHSTREITDGALSEQQISEILWSADGINRPPKGRTAPSAMGRYPVQIFAITPEGTFLYDPAKHALNPVASGDHRRAAGMQEFVYISPLNLIFVGDYEKLEGGRGSLTDEMKLTWCAIEAGACAQNVYLYCASEGLGATVRTSVDASKLAEPLKLRASQHVICGLTIGVPKPAPAR